MGNQEDSSVYDYCRSRPRRFSPTRLVGWYRAREGGHHSCGIGENERDYYFNGGLIWQERKTAKTSGTRKATGRSVMQRR